MLLIIFVGANQKNLILTGVNSLELLQLSVIDGFLGTGSNICPVCNLYVHVS